MQIFLDTINTNEIEYFSTLGLIDGITTNPSLFSKIERDYYNTLSQIKECKERGATLIEIGERRVDDAIFKNGNWYKRLEEICELVDDNVSAQVVGDSSEEMLAQAKELVKISDKIVVKVPITEEGLKVCNQLSMKGYRVNTTLCFSPAQAILAAKAGATFVSPFIGRVEDYGGDGLQLIRDIVEIYTNYPEFETQILAASIRNIEHVVGAAKAGADIVTVPTRILHQMFSHKLTEDGLKKFDSDWDKYQKRQ